MNPFYQHIRCSQEELVQQTAGIEASKPRNYSGRNRDRIDGWGAWANSSAEAMTTWIDNTLHPVDAAVPRRIN
jgi:hypothetical protein